MTGLVVPAIRGFVAFGLGGGHAPDATPRRPDPARATVRPIGPDPRRATVKER